MDIQDTTARAQISLAEHEQQVQNEVASVIAIDLPRITRSDVTRLSEMILKFAGFPGTFHVLETLVVARNALLEFSANTASAGAPTMAGPGASLEAPVTERTPPKPREQEPWERAGGIQIDAGAKDILLVAALVQGGFVSSTGRAMRGVREGFVLVNGEKVTTPTALLEPGIYTIKVGDGEAQKVTIR